MSFDPTVSTPSPIPAYIGSIVRWAVGAGAGWLINKGYVTSDQTPELVGGAMALAAVVWSLLQKFQAHKTLKAAVAS